MSAITVSKMTDAAQARPSIDEAIALLDAAIANACAAKDFFVEEKERQLLQAQLEFEVIKPHEAPPEPEKPSEYVTRLEIQKHCKYTSRNGVKRFLERLGDFPEGIRRNGPFSEILYRRDEVNECFKRHKIPLMA